MSETFAVHLGGGAYLDADGNLVFGPSDKAQIYQAPAGFHVDPDKLKETFKSLSDLLPEDDDAKEKWKKWGVPENIVNFLGDIAGIAGIIATAVSVYFWVLGVMLTIMSLMTDDDGLTPGVAKAFADIKNQLQGMEQIQRADSIINKYSEFDGRVSSMRTLLTQLAIEKPGPVRRAEIFDQMLDLVNGLDVPLSNLQNQEWATTYDPNAHKSLAFASSLLVHQRSDGTLAPVAFNEPGVTRFDYRLGVPLLLYGATTYTALLQIAMPWFRSAGLYAGQLRDTAAAIDRFVIRMQNESLARTEYTAQTVFQQQIQAIFAVPSNHRPALARGYYAVGAFDLVRYSDSFLWDRFNAQFQAGLNSGERGLFNYNWHTNEIDLDKIAAAANEQARQDYANLQAATGILRLIKTAAWLRFLSTPPLASQTVTGSVNDSRTFQDEQPAIATSPYIFPIGVIEHPATLKRYRARSRARITSQEPGYTPAFSYRVVLRTIDSRFGNDGWARREYVGDVWRAEYEPVRSDKRLNRLRTDLNRGRVLFEEVIYEGPSPAEAITPLRGEMWMPATTFDWYVPVTSPWSRYNAGVSLSVENLAAHLASPGTGSGKTTALGGISPYLLTATAGEPAPMQILRGQGPLLFNRVDEIFDLGDILSLTDVSLDLAERRHVRVEEVMVQWQLNWELDKLEVRLAGRPDDRPFQVHVVIEERVFSGEALPEGPGNVFDNPSLVEHLHTPFVAELVNQLYLVPESFFDEEQRSLEEGRRMWYDFLRRFSEQTPVGPGDPIESLQRITHEMAVSSSSTAMLASVLDEQVAFASHEAPEIWEAVVNG